VLEGCDNMLMNVRIFTAFSKIIRSSANGAEHCSANEALMIEVIFILTEY
jgi:hypothetical protein